MVGLFVSSSHLQAQISSSISVAWDASTSPEVASYVVRYGTASQVYTLTTNVGNQTSANLSGLQAGQTYYVAVTARNSAGAESVPSNEIAYQVPNTALPVVTLTAPIANANYQSPATITCAATVVTNGHIITKVQFLSGSTVMGEDNLPPYNYTWNNVSVGNYNLAARVVYDSGSTVSSSATPVIVTNPPIANGLTFESTAGVITAPFVASGGMISQATDTTLATGGRAVYTFNVTTPGDYLVAANVIAPDSAQNSFFVNIDTEPTDPYMVWHLPPTTTLQSRTVSWQGNGTVDSSQFAPKIFTLSAGSHQLIIRGREANACLGTITLTQTNISVPPTIALTAPSDSAQFTAPASIPLTASVTANGHTITKVQFFNGSALLGEDTSAPFGFTWSSVNAGTYNLKARAVYDSGSTADSASSTVVVAGLPAPWQTKDIGATGLTGNVSESNGVYTVRGAGRISGTSDSFRFVYQTLSGDGEIKLRLNSIQTGNTNGSFGVMIRESLSPNAKYAFMGVSQDLKYRWQRRSSSGGSTASTVSSATTPPNTWVRLLRTGSTLVGYQSTNGTNWTKVSSRNITMATNIYVGFVVASGSTNAQNTAVFSNGFVTP
jgi:hypothetical protein